MDAIPFENNAVTGRHTARQPDGDACPLNINDFAQSDTPFGGTETGHQHFVITALQPTRRETSREGQFHFLDLLGREGYRTAGAGRVDGGAIMSRDIRHVLGRLQSTFDLERTDPGRHHFGN